MCTILLSSVLFLILNSVAVHGIDLEDMLKGILNPAIPRKSNNFDIETFLNGYGYPFENHEVTTQDGYILGLHRIPNSRHNVENSQEIKSKPTVFIMHGMDSSSVDFFILGPDKSLALMLADQGYDVWLGNNRGNTWSRRHVSLDPDKDKQFWDYSFHELGMYDNPAIIDYILNSTGKEKISYVGHSQGNTQFFVMTSSIPKYNDKINLMIALAPPVFMGNLTNPIVQIVKDYFLVFDLATIFFNMTEILPHSGLLTRILKSLCKMDSYQEICVTFFFTLLGFDSAQLNRTEFTIFLDNFPAGTSLKEYKHFLQEVKSGHFRQYDYGWIKNMIRYRQMLPPDYNLSKTTVPIALYYGNNDWLVGKSDVDRLAEKLPNVIEKHLIEYDQFNHGDFLIAKDVISLVYSDVLAKLSGYNTLPATELTSISTTTTQGIFSSQKPSSSSTLSALVSTPSASSRLISQIMWIQFMIMIVNLVL